MLQAWVIVSIVLGAVVVTAVTQLAPLLIVAGIPLLVKGTRIAYNIGGDGDAYSAATRWRGTAPWWFPQSSDADLERKLSGGIVAGIGAMLTLAAVIAGARLFGV